MFLVDDNAGEAAEIPWPQHGLLSLEAPGVEDRGAGFLMERRGTPRIGLTVDFHGHGLSLPGGVRTSRRRLRPSAGFAIRSLFPAMAGKVFLAPDLAKGDAAGRRQEMAML